MAIRKAAALIAALTVSLGGIVEANVLVILRETATPGGGIVTLRDLAEIRGDDTAEIERIASLTLCPTPADNRETRITFDTIRARLMASGADLSHLEFGGVAEVRVKGSSAAASSRPATGMQPRPETVRNAASAPQSAAAPPSEIANVRPVPAAETQSRPNVDARRRQIEQSVAAAIRRHLMLNAAQLGTFDLKTQLSPADLSTLELSAMGGFDVSGGHAPWTGKQFFLLQFLDAQDRIREVSVPVEIAARPMILSAAYPIPRGQMLEPKDLTWRPAENESELSAATDPSQLLGREAVTAFKPGQALRSSDVKAVALVHTGEFVTVTSRKPGIAVQRAMRAKADGSAGDVIPVQTLEDRRTVLVRVTGRQEAETVEMTTTPPTSAEIARVTNRLPDVTMQTSAARLERNAAVPQIPTPALPPIQQVSQDVRPASHGQAGSAAAAAMPPVVTAAVEPPQTAMPTATVAERDPPRVMANPVAPLSVPAAGLLSR